MSYLVQVYVLRFAILVYLEDGRRESTAASIKFGFRLGNNTTETFKMLKVIF
jgi:hypothetical protein